MRLAPAPKGVEVEEAEVVEVEAEEAEVVGGDPGKPRSDIIDSYDSDARAYDARTRRLHTERRRAARSHPRPAD
jgi:hypothetical protein